MRVGSFAMAAVLVGCRPASSEHVPASDGSVVDAPREAGTQVRRRELEARILGQPLGTMAVERSPLPGGGERWTMTMRMTLALDDPGESAKTMETEEVIEYDAERRFVRSTEIDRERGVEERTEMVREGDQLRVLVEGPSHRDERRFPIPADYASEQAVFHALVAEVEAGKPLPRARTYLTFDEERMMFRERTFTLQARATMTVGRESIAGWDVASTDADGERTRGMYDDAAMPLRVEQGVFTAALVGSTAAAGKVKLSSYLEVKGALDAKADPLELELVVEGDEADLPPALRDSEYQSVKRRGGVYSLALHAVACDATCDGRALPMKVPADVQPFTKPSPASQSAHESIVERAKSIVAGRTDARAVAETIVMWVFESLEKRDGVRGAATAVETLAEGGGDCTEHAALTVALLRAAGVPARNTNGIVLIPGWFGSEAGYHAWVEVWLGKWVAMDPALGRVKPGAHYIRFGHDEPGMDDGGSAMSRLLGRTVIRAR